MEVLNEDGTMARRPDLETFADRHGLKLGTIADLIQYRCRNEKTITPAGECVLSTEFGPFRLVSFEDGIDGALHLALVRGVIDPGTPVLVRVHMQDHLCDTFGSTGAGCSWPLRSALRRIAREESGVIVVLRPPEASGELAARIRRLGGDTDGDAPAVRSEGADMRTFGVGAQILSELGVRHMRLLSAPKRFHALSGFGLEVVEYVDCD